MILIVMNFNKLKILVKMKNNYKMIIYKILKIKIKNLKMNDFL